MTDTRGTFRLKNVRNDVLNNQYVPIPSVWVNTPSPGVRERWFDEASTASNWGLWLGGTPGPKSNAFKIDFSNDTTSNPGPGAMTITNAEQAGANSVSKSYAMGGSTSPGNQVQKYTWSAGTFSATPTLPLNGSNFGNGCESSTHAYNISGSGQYAVQKISFSDDTTSSIPISPTGNEPGYVYMAMLGDTSQTYMCGGNGSDFGTTITKYTFSSDTYSINPATLPTSTRRSAYSSSPTTGFVCGGDNPSVISSIQKFTFASETASNSPSNQGRNAYRHCAVGSDVASYLNGGYGGWPNDFGTTVAKLTYATETVEQRIATIPAPNGYYNRCSISARDMGPSTQVPPAATPTPSSTPQSPTPAPQIAYHMAGRTSHPSGTEMSSCGKIVFSTETGSALPGSNIPARKFCGGTGSATAAYCFGGSNTIAKLLYATDAASTLPSTLPAGYSYKCAVSNDTIAYTFGGYQPDYSIIDKLTFSNDTVSANTPTSRPDTIRNSCGHFSSPTKGYFSTGANYNGGTPASRKSHYITFATDSGSGAPEHPSPRNSIFSCGNATHAYTTGGRGPDSSSPREQSNTAKFTYSNETWSNVPGAPLSARTYYGDGAATQTFGYFSGGSTGGAGPAVKATSRKFTFASETMGPGASLSTPKWGFGFAASTESNHPQTTPQPNIPHVI